MISGLLSQLQNQYGLQNAPNAAPAVGDPNGLSGLLQTSGVPMVENQVGMRTPDYMGLLGMLGQQPFTPGYTGMGGNAGGVGQSDYLDRVLGSAGQGGTSVQQQPVGLETLLKYGGLVSNPYWDGSPEPVGRPGDLLTQYFNTSQYLTPDMLRSFEQTKELG